MPGEGGEKEEDGGSVAGDEEVAEEEGREEGVEMGSEVVLAGVDDEVEALQGCQREDVLIIIVVVLLVVVAVLLGLIGVSLLEPCSSKLSIVSSFSSPDAPARLFLFLLLQSITTATFTTISIAQQAQQKLQQRPQMCLKQERCFLCVLCKGSLKYQQGFSACLRG